MTYPRYLDTVRFLVTVSRGELASSRHGEVVASVCENDCCLNYSAEPDSYIVADEVERLMGAGFAAQLGLPAFREPFKLWITGMN